ncbi:unnamed protein product [Cuscuta epithymum]|uniref:GTD-binding domain-containing protein n=1 Tax=Cuscuta epithymum TaxID=186058 RepID=A0AAV0ERD9_9ASTE|nr:unnamed protein product [Cuscuta epithymum]CAH9125698.1 unnamed protein product [Cuscuta epithymum]
MDCFNLYKHFDTDFDFGFGFLFFNMLCLFLLFLLGLMNWFFKWLVMHSRELNCGFCSKDGFDLHSGSKVGSCKPWKNYSALPDMDMPEEIAEENDENHEEEDGNGEDKVFDVFTLRKMVKDERRKAKCAELELEKERMASASAAEEAMAMILRLQKDKSRIEMEFKQYKRLAQEKQHHDQEVIRWLQWLVSKQELSSESVAMEDKLRFGGQSWKQFMMMNNGDSSEDETSTWCSPNPHFHHEIRRRLFSSLDLDLSLELDTN